MKVGIYNEPSGLVGGSEYTVAVAANGLVAEHDVEIVHHNPSLTADHLRELSGLPLRGVRLRLVGRETRPDPQTPSGIRFLRQRWVAERQWHATLSRPYDVFIASIHGVPPFCHAPIGILLVLFPMHDRGTLWPWSEDGGAGGTLKSRLRRLGFDAVWRRRFSSYRHRLSISEYTRRWVQAWWHVDSTVVYPPVDTHFAPSSKRNLVLSVGRFSAHPPSKRQAELMGIYQELQRGALREWCCCSAGGLSDRSEDRAYFHDVESIAAACGARVIPNVPREQLRTLYQQARIFWHAAGFGGNQVRNPFEAEHFGIVTVEAMAAGAVPVVFDQGGQSEIVEHGRSGLLWRTLDELREHTIALATDEALWERMSHAARERAGRYSRERFERQIVGLVS